MGRISTRQKISDLLRESPELMSSKEISNRLNCAVTTVRQWVPILASKNEICRAVDQFGVIIFGNLEATINFYKSQHSVSRARTHKQMEALQRENTALRMERNRDKIRLNDLEDRNHRLQLEVLKHTSRQAEEEKFYRGMAFEELRSKMSIPEIQDRYVTAVEAVENEIIRREGDAA